ncbi:MAG: hypothetical protein WCK32_01055 [Chlorobiaceae bacterium]
MKKETKSSATPLAIGVLVISLLTVFMIVLHVAIGFSPSALVGLSSLFIIAVMLHTTVNWKQFT